jgi:uncharacterized membrane protein YkgB
MDRMSVAGRLGDIAMITHMLWSVKNQQPWRGLTKGVLVLDTLLFVHTIPEYIVQLQHSSHHFFFVVRSAFDICKAVTLSPNMHAQSPHLTTVQASSYSSQSRP